MGDPGVLGQLERAFDLVIALPWPDDKQQAYVITARTKRPGGDRLASTAVVMANDLKGHGDPSALLGDAAGRVVANLLRDVGE